MDESPPDDCTCPYTMSARQKTKIGDDENDYIRAKLIKAGTDPDCPLHG